MNSGQRAYLEALEIPVWVRKDLAGSAPAFEPCSLKLGPGSGQVLMVVAALEEQATHLASDIARCLRSEPVWAWPGTSGEDDELSQLVREHLFTHIVVFGDELAAGLFDGPAPATLGSARLVCAPSMQDLSSSPAGRKALWKLVSSNGLAHQAKT